MKILQIEPNATDAAAVKLALKAASFNIYTTDDADEGFDLARLYEYDAIVLGLPDAAAFLRRLRSAKIDKPVLVLTYNEDATSLVDAFAAGADDYQVKPVLGGELAARLQAIVRRANGHARSLLQIGDVTLDLHARVVLVAGERIHFTNMEYRMLELMALRKGTTITKEGFLNQLYGGMDEPEIKIIDVFICKLRKKLRDAGARPLIETIWGRGYVMREGLASPVESGAA